MRAAQAGQSLQLFSFLPTNFSICSTGPSQGQQERFWLRTLVSGQRANLAAPSGQAGGGWAHTECHVRPPAGRPGRLSAAAPINTGRWEFQRRVGKRPLRSDCQHARPAVQCQPRRNSLGSSSCSAALIASQTGARSPRTVEEENGGEGGNVGG